MKQSFLRKAIVLAIALSVVVANYCASQWAANPCLAGNAVTIVVLGSSTAAGTGPTSSDSTWVNRYRKHLQDINPANQVINLAVGGFTTYRIMPHSFSSPIPGRPPVDSAHNITHGLTFNPDAFIVNMPSNDRQWPRSEQLANFDSLYRHSTNNGVPMWICTTQPLANPIYATYQADVRDSINAIYGAYAIEFWAPLADTDSTVLDIYDSGDGVHLNNAGHRILWSQVLDINIPSQVITPVAIPDYAAFSIDLSDISDCVDSTQSYPFKVSVSNIGSDNGFSSTVTTSYFGSGQAAVISVYNVGPLATCDADTFVVNASFSSSGLYTFCAELVQSGDTNSTNDSICVTKYIHIEPWLRAINDTGCIAGNYSFGVATQADTVIWYSTLSSTAPLGGGLQFNASGIYSDSAFYAEAIDGPLHHRGAVLTTNISTVNWNGAMFDVFADTVLVLDSFALKIADPGLQAVDIYIKTGRFLGSELMPGAWTLWHTASTVVNNPNSFVNISFPPINMAQADTVAIYLQLNNPASRLSYRSGISSAQTRSDGLLSVRTGSGVSYNFSAAYYPRDWNGMVFYHYGHNADGDCKSDRIPVWCNVSEPELFLGNDTIIISPDSILIDAGSGWDNYLWDNGSTTQTVWVSEDYVFANGNIVSVQVTNRFGCIAEDQIIVRFDYLGLAQARATDFTIYPNPASDLLHVQTDNVEEVAIYNMLGVEMLSTTVSNSRTALDVSTLRPGLYFIQIGTQQHPRAFVKQ